MNNNLCVGSLWRSFAFWLLNVLYAAAVWLVFLYIHRGLITKSGAFPLGLLLAAAWLTIPIYKRRTTLDAREQVGTAVFGLSVTVAACTIAALAALRH